MLDLETEVHGLFKQDPLISKFLYSELIGGVWYWSYHEPGNEWLSPPLEAIIGKDVLGGHGRRTLEAFKDEAQRAAPQLGPLGYGQTKCFEKTIRLNSRQAMTLRAFCVHNQHGDPARVLVICKDAEMLVRTQKVLREAASVLQNSRKVVREREYELAVYKEQAEQAARSRALFLTGMSHEVRTPLNCVIGLAEALQLTGLDPRQSDMVNTIHSSGQHLLKVMESLLDLSRIRSSDSTQHKQGFSIASLISEVTSAFARDVEVKGLQIIEKVQPGVENELQGNPIRIRQVLLNLFKNALNHTGTGSITIEAELIPGDGPQLLQLSVIDTGCGIEDAHKEQIFNSFENSDGNEPHTAGFGLTISRSICEMHGGTLSVEDTPGGGATFIACFRVQTSEKRPTVTPAKGIIPGRLYDLGRELTVLVAEDNPANQKVLEAVLHKAPVALHFATNGEEALKMMAALKYDLVLVDLAMPVMGGVEMVRMRRLQERRNPNQGHALMYAWSALQLTDEAEEIREYGFDGLLRKPLDTRRLQKVLEEASGRKRPRELPAPGVLPALTDGRKDNNRPLAI